MPMIFKKVYPRLTIIVDCTEIEMEKPSSLDAQSACYSSYKSRTTMKALLGITPSGVLCFVSEFFPGSTSDKEITVQSGFLTKLKPGDQVMADKGFNCQDELASVGATLVIPAFLKGTKQFNKEQAEHNKKVASLRIHVERLMERLKNWHIFDHKIPVSLTPIATDILITAGNTKRYDNDNDSCVTRETVCRDDYDPLEMITTPERGLRPPREDYDSLERITTPERGLRLPRDDYDSLEMITTPERGLRPPREDYDSLERITTPERGLRPPRDDYDP
ncbi:hypothetical protein QZH41_004726 [Actinostola sp. cb2023]|nr:hypothetical protein QZH41_004726 [Actinostola sp. cb2023]